MTTGRRDSLPARRSPLEPSHKELNAKLRRFREQLAADEVLLVDAKKFRRDLERLGLDTTDEVMDLLRAMQEEIRPEHYCPPHKRKECYELDGAPLYDFVWESTFRRERMYVKFAVADDQCYLVSCHPDSRERES